MKLNSKTDKVNKKGSGKFKKNMGGLKPVNGQQKKKKSSMKGDKFSAADLVSESIGTPSSPKKGGKAKKGLTKFKTKVKANKKASTNKKVVKGTKDPEDEDNLDGFEDDDECDSSEEDALVDASSMSRKEYLKKLKKTDPEFYKTMMQSADLMDLNSSDEENGDENDDDVEIGDEEGDASSIDEEEEDETQFQSENEDDDIDEDSDTELNETKHRGGNVTQQMIDEWEEGLRSSSPLEAFLEAQQGFLAAIESLSGGKEEPEERTSQFTVKGSQCFNSIVRLCLKNMAPALRTIFQLKDANHLPHKSKKWNKYKGSIKLYLRQLIVLTEVVADPSVAEAVLKNGVLPLIPFYAGYKTMSKLLARRLVVMWATSDKKVRVLAFMAMFRLTQIIHGNFLEWMLKKMYIAYVQNCRFTSPATWGLIDFMRISLVELYSLDYARAYRHGFIYIRQMAIHLRNAILHPQKDRVQLVYNWQYIHCLNLWCDLLGKSHPNPTLQLMIFPVTQVAIGTMKLQPTPTFFPLAFHVCKMLTELSRTTGTFIPVLPFLLEILNKAIFFKQPKKASIKPFDWMCMLRLSRSEMRESAFKDGIVDQVYDGMVKYLSVVSASIGFPDFVLPIVMQLKACIKKCKNANYCKKFRQLLDKIQENRIFIEERRKDVKFGIADTKAVKDWEISVKQAGTPLNKYYESWCKIQDKEHQQRLADSVSVKDYDLPSTKKRLRDNQEEELDAMFNSEDEEEDEDDVSDDARPEDDDDVSNGHPTKKLKMDEDEDEEDEEDPTATLDDLKAACHNGVDVVKEFEFSDLEDDLPDDDEYGGNSDS